MICYVKIILENRPLDNGMITNGNEKEDLVNHEEKELRELRASRANRRTMPKQRITEKKSINLTMTV